MTTTTTISTVAAIIAVLVLSVTAGIEWAHGHPIRAVICLTLAVASVTAYIWATHTEGT